LFLAGQTKARMGLPETAPISLTPIIKGGSDRSFFRCLLPVGNSCILMRYSLEKEENGYFLEIARYLDAQGVSVPKIIFHDPEYRLIWMEDMGEEDLHASKNDPWEKRALLYREALKTVRVLHGLSTDSSDAKQLRLMPSFDDKLYAWERNYFFERFVHEVCHFEFSAGQKTDLDFEIEELARMLCTQPTCFVHRDFQSQNILLNGGRAFLIDFQGMRHGTLFYDLGSLLYDPYVPFGDEERIELLRYYWEFGGSAQDWEYFATLFHAAAAQRLMQALGAYGFLGLHKGKTDFLKHIPAGLHNLETATEKAGCLPHLHDLAKACKSILKNQSIYAFDGVA